MRKLLKAIANRFGYDIHQLRPIDRASGFELYRYRKPYGTFDYDKYKEIQIAGNKRKLGDVWVVKENIAFLADYITKHVGSVAFGLCHGTRRGKEQEWFKEYLKCDVIGTDISDTAEQFPNTIQWDFHEIKPEWIDAVDFIYSNSFDHSYDPQKCLKAWMSCIKKGGCCIIEHTSAHEKATELDPFGADISIMPFLILKWGKGNFCVRELLDAPFKPDCLFYVQYLIIQRL
jgi:Methyltransferase domain